MYVCGNDVRVYCVYVYMYVHMVPWFLCVAFEDADDAVDDDATPHGPCSHHVHL